MSHNCIIVRDDYANGYMTVWRGGRSVTVSRLLCAFTHNLRYDDQSWVARHVCDNRACIRVEHIIPGTRADNVRDRDMRNRTARGTRNGKTKLTPEQVDAIRADHRTHQVIADAYNVARSTVSMIKSGERR